VVVTGGPGIEYTANSQLLGSLDKTQRSTEVNQAAIHPVEDPGVVAHGVPVWQKGIARLWFQRHIARWGDPFTRSMPKP
jgi:hypothetical protein